MPHNAPIDQAQGLRRLFAHARTRFIPVVSNPHVTNGGMMLERLCTGFAERGARTLVVDAAERASAHSELALLDLAACVEPLSEHVSYLPARGLPLRFVDARGSTHRFLEALAQAAPQTQVVLVHASAKDLCRLFSRRSNPDVGETEPVCPLLLADDRTASVTHAYAAMKLLTLRAGLMVHELMLCAPSRSPRAERIAMQLAVCADDFLGAVVRDWVKVDPRTKAVATPTAALRRWVKARLVQQGPTAAAEAIPSEFDVPLLPAAGKRHVATNWAFN